MAPAHALQNDGIGADSTTLEEVVDRFEQAWQVGNLPRLEDFLPPGGALRQALLVELVHVDLEYRLKAKEAARVEQYLGRYPDLAADPAAALDLILAEYELRNRLEGPIPFSEYLQRFPAYREALAQRRPGPRGEVTPEASPAPTVAMPHPDPAAAVGPPPTPELAATRRTILPPLHAASEGSPSAAEPAPAYQRVGDYEILGVLGRGGMGVVYKARQVALKRLVALKMILGGPHAGPERLARFRMEAEAVAQVQHPNIVQVYEVGEHDGRPFFSLEFLEGGSLDRKLGRAPLPARDAAALLETLARAVHVAHTRGIIHRDLKPANVLLTADGTPKITDFGLAKQVAAESGRTHSGEVMGTPSYMAPEQAEGKVKNVGPAADVYALGAMLYEFLTSRPPFQGDSVYDTLEQVRTREPVPVRRLQPKVPRDLETICLKCLLKDPRKRYGTAEALAEDVRRFRAGEPIRARPVSAWERAYKWARRRPAQVALVAAVTAALLCGVTGAVFYGLYQRQRAMSEGQRAAALAERWERQQTRDRHWRQGLEEEKAGQLEAAQEQFGLALATLDAEPGGDPADRRRLERDRDRVADQVRARASRRDFQERSQRFDGYRSDILFRQLDITKLPVHGNRDQLRPFTDLIPKGNRAAIRREAPAALAEFGLTAEDPPAEVARRLAAYREHAASPQQIDEIAAKCYEVLLLWAMAEAPQQPARGAGDQSGTRRALRLLDLAAALGEAYHLPTTRTFHQRRADYLALLGDNDGARAARALAKRQKPETALDLCFTALDCYLQNNFAQAVAACERVQALAPEHFWAWYLQALCHLNTRQWGEAKAELSACLSRQPELFWPWLLRATARSVLGEWEAAEDDFAQALRRAADPLERWAARTNRGAMWVGRQRWSEAVTDLREAIAERCDAYEGYVNLAQAYRGRGVLAQSAAGASTVGLLGSAPGQGPLMAASALVPGRTQDLDAAVAELDRALALRRDDARLYATRARLQLDRGDRAAAQRDFKQAIAHEPRGSTSERLVSAYVELGHLQHLARDYEAALTSLQAALRLRPDYAPALRQCAETHLALKHYREAGEALDRYLLSGPPAPEVYLARGLIHAQLGQYAEAVAAYNRAQELRPGANTLSFRGWAYLKLDAARPALADFQAALRLQPGHTDALAGLGRARVRAGQLAAAVEDAEASLRPGRPTAPLLLNAACVYALAVGRLEAYTGGRGSGAGTAYLYQERAVELLRAALDQFREGQRRAYWRENIEHERDLVPIHGCTSYRALARSYAP
jgi:tetratricopeptide (TPR) repeat protein